MHKLISLLLVYIRVYARLKEGFHVRRRAHGVSWAGVAAGGWKTIVDFARSNDFLCFFFVPFRRRCVPRGVAVLTGPPNLFLGRARVVCCVWVRG